MASSRKKINRELLRSAVRDYCIKNDDIESIFSDMANSGGFESRNLAYGVDILKRMISDPELHEIPFFCWRTYINRCKRHCARHDEEEYV